MAKKIFAALALVLMGFFALPLAANAAGYPPDGNVLISGNKTPGGVVHVEFSQGFFTGGESVHFTVDGAGTVSIAAFKAATVSTDKAANTNGSIAFDITLPANASGTYTVTGTGSQSGTTGSASFTVTAADAGGSTATNAGSGLADTGSTISMLAIWVASGLVLLGAAFVTVRVIVRRQSRVDA